jgi:carboxyl-terminal processing protease
LYTFTRDSVEQIFKMLKDAEQNDREAVILDLRGNPGGLLDSAIEIASMILPKGSVIVRERPSSTKHKKEDSVQKRRI